ncbi:hypothetical protein GYB22_10095 [bacterium]|nr:hypothetical protein [bacterium]
MKNLIPLLCFVFVLSLGFISGNSKLHDYAPDDGEVLTFTADIKLGLSSIHHKRGSFDGTNYEFRKTRTDSIYIVKLKDARSNHQSELNIFYSNGKISRSGEFLNLHCLGAYENLYLVSMETKEITKFEGAIDLKLKGEDANGNMIVPRIDDNINLQVYCLPPMIDRSALFKMRHKKETLGFFSQFEVTNSKGEVQNFPPGDYLLFSGNALVIQ